MKHIPKVLIAVGLLVGFASSSYALEIEQNRPLTFYGVEMKRENKVTLKEFKNYARSHGQANYVVSRSPFVTYEGSEDVILADYELGRTLAEALAEKIPGGAKILEINVAPVAMSEKRSIGVYKVPLLPDTNAIFGDVWVQAGKSSPIRLEKNIVLDATNQNLANLFKFVGFADKEGALVYCLEECIQYDLVSGNSTAHNKTKSIDAAGIHRSVDKLLTKENAEACKNKMTATMIQNIDKSGYYRGVCPVKGQDSILEVQLKKDSGSWKVIHNTWKQPMPNQK